MISFFNLIFSPDMNIFIFILTTNLTNIGFRLQRIWKIGFMFTSHVQYKIMDYGMVYITHLCVSGMLSSEWYIFRIPFKGSTIWMVLLCHHMLCLLSMNMCFCAMQNKTFTFLLSIKHFWCKLCQFKDRWGNVIWLT